ncbi:MAG: hypothetical protein ACI4L6_02470 [Candidatus Onthoplasma sp.]
MTKNSTIKRILIMVTTILSITMFSLLAVVAVSSTVLDSHRENNISRAATTTYDFANGALTSTSTNYTSNTNFTISGVAGLKNFAFSVSNGCSFEGKTVSLSNDIDCTGENIPVIGACKENETYYERYKVTNGPYGWFNGTFNGQNYSLSNITSKIWCANILAVAPLGFFSEVCDGIVKNLRFYKYTLDYDGNIQDADYVAPLIGKVRGDIIIDNIWIDGFTFQGKGVDSISSLICDSYVEYDKPNLLLSISNVLINDITISTGYDRYYIIGPSSIGSEDADLKWTAEAKFSNCVILADGEISVLTDSGNDSISYSAINIFQNSYDLSKLGEEYWWQNDNYNNGRPCLKKFIEFNTIYFKVNDSNLGSVSISQIELPKYSDMSKSENLSISANNSNGCVYAFTSTNVIAKAISKSGGEFKEWTYNANTNTYTATFTRKPVNVVFNPVQVTESGNNAPGISNPSSIPLVIQIQYGTTLSIEYSPNLKEISFRYLTGGVGSSETYTIYGYGWYFSGLGYSGTESNVKNLTSGSTTLTLTTDISFEPTYSYKLYEVTFQTSGFANSNYVKPKSSNSAYTFNLEYGTTIKQTITGDVQANLEFNDGTEDRTITYTITDGQYYISGVNYSVGSASGDKYTVKSDVTISPNVNKRTTTMPQITFKVLPNSTLKNVNTGQNISSDYSYSFISGSTLRYNNNTSNKKITLKFINSGVVYATFEYDLSGSLSNPKFTLGSTEYAVQNTDTDIVITTSATLTPKYTYEVTIKKNTLVGMTADEKIGIDYGSAVTITFSTTDIDSKSYDVVTITYYNNGQANTKTYTINNNVYFIKTVTVDGTICKRENKKTTINFGAKNLSIYITTAQKTYNAVFN